MEENTAAYRDDSRLFFVDWLRIFAVLMLFPYHTLRVFDPPWFYAKAPVLSPALVALQEFIRVWHMPLLFLLAGFSTYLSLRKRSGGLFARERIKRLLVPFVFGFFFLMPLVTWYAARQSRDYAGSYWQYLSSGDFLRWHISVSLGHLWFILLLLVFSLVALPLIARGARGRGAGRVQSFSRRLSRPVWWLLPMVILFIGDAVPDIFYRPSVFYFFVFLLGFVAACDPTFVESAERYRWPAFICGLALTLLWVVLNGYFRESLYPLPLDGPGLAFLRVAACWLMLMGAMGLGKRYLNRASRPQRYLAESSYPVYILHMVMIVVIAYYVVQLAVPSVVQWLVLIVAAVLATFAAYEAARRVVVTRFLLGMKPRQRTQRPAGEQGRPSSGQPSQLVS